MLNRLTSTLDFQSQALTLRAERQRLLASNIANADTPGYVSRDISFAQSLRQATGSIAASSTLTTSRPGHLPGRINADRSTASGAELAFALPSQTNLDRNTVDMDRERASFADNSVKYEATLRFINGSVRTMLTAITGQ